MRPEVLTLALPFAAAFAICMVFAPGVIDALRRRGIGQTISDDGPDSHRPKAGTPTMGGLAMLAGILGSALITSWAARGSGAGADDVFGRAHAIGAHDLLAVLLLMAAFALLGIIDDYLTIRPAGAARGISSKPKALLQIVLAAGFVLWAAYGRPAEFSPILFFAKNPLFGGAFYWVFSVLFIVGMANFVNITDGLDGLVSGLTAITCVAFVAIIALVPPHEGFQQVSLMALLMGMAGACAAFLWFNANPAKVFMGDTGSLALGVGLPAVAILTHREALMIVVGMVFILDGLSTAVQWAVFKFTRIRTGTGRRVFRKSPIHHHFEMGGWPEQTVVVRFWILGAVFAVAALAGAAWGWW